MYSSFAKKNNSQIQFEPEKCTWRSTSFTLSISPCWATLVIWKEEKRSKFLMIFSLVLIEISLANRDCYPGLQLIACVGPQLFLWEEDCKLSIALHCWRLSNTGLFKTRSFLQLFRPQCRNSSGQPSNQCTFSIKYLSQEPVCVLNFLQTHTIVNICIQHLYM